MGFWRSSDKKGVLDHRIIFRDWSQLRSPEDFEDPLLGSLACLLMTFGEFAFDTENVKAADVKAACDGWIRHLLEHEPAPPGTVADGNPETQWKGLNRYFKVQRREEQDFVLQSLAGFRNLVWDFLREMSQSVDQDKDSNEGIREHLGSLEQSVKSESVAELRRRVLETARSIRENIVQRERRQEEQMRQLGGRLRKMRAELVEVRNRMALDPLTKVHNRQAFDEQIERMVQFSRFSGSSACLYVVDADDFKSINDEAGHQAGDCAIKGLADCCIRCFPREADFIARYGGDEFAIIVEEAPLSVCEVMANRLVQTARETRLEWKGEPIQLSASVGVALLAPGDDTETWFGRADHALRRAKSMGKGQIVVDSEAPGESPEATAAEA
ncbi:MAG: diguanylate cyclase [Acidobacteriota bacterium]